MSASNYEFSDTLSIPTYKKNPFIKSLLSYNFYNIYTYFLF